MHPHLIWIPIVIIIALAVVFFARRSTGGERSGMDERDDRTEPRELRGPEQRNNP